MKHIFSILMLLPCLGAGPLVITAGGDYEGGTYSTPLIKTSSLVWINRANFTVGVTAAIGDTSATSRPNVIFTNCTFNGLPARYGFANWSLAGLKIEHCSFETTGVVVLDAGAPSVLIRYNKVHNISGALTSTTCNKVSAFQLDKIHSPNIEISWNQAIHDPGSAVEDVISFAQSGGTPTSRAKIHDNYIKGQYAYPANHNSSGSGIMCFDPAGGVNLNLHGYTDCTNNYVCNVANAGIDAAGSGFITIDSNVVLNCGTGPRTWNWENKTLPAAYGPFVVTNNQSNTFSLAPKVTTSSGNVATKLTVADLDLMWVSKMQAAGITVGVVPVCTIPVAGNSYFVASEGVQGVPLSKENLGPPTAAGYTTVGSWVKYREVDFGIHGAQSITLTAASMKDCVLTISADSSVLAAVPIKATGGWYKYSDVTLPVALVKGNHWITVSFSGSANLKAFVFK